MRQLQLKITFLHGLNIQIKVEINQIVVDYFTDCKIKNLLTRNPFHNFIGGYLCTQLSWFHNKCLNPFSYKMQKCRSFGEIKCSLCNYGIQIMFLGRCKYKFILKQLQKFKQNHFNKHQYPLYPPKHSLSLTLQCSLALFK